MGEINYMESDVKYIEGENHIVIASKHLHLLPDSKLPIFIQKTSDLAGMKIEGRELPSFVPYNCIENLAKACMGGKPCEWLAGNTPDGKVLGTLLKEYGLPTEVSEVFIGLTPMYLKDMKPIRNGEEMAEAVQIAIETSKERFPDLDIDRAWANHVRVLESLLDSQIQLSELIYFCNACALYRGPIIQYEFMAPDIEDFRKRINGKIGIIVGSYHARYIHQMLEGTPTPKPISWQDFKQALPYKTAKIIQSIEDLVLNHKD